MGDSNPQKLRKQKSNKSASGKEKQAPPEGETPRSSDPARSDRKCSERKRLLATTPEEPLTKVFAGNEYTGPVQKDSLGIRCFDVANGQYAWPGQARYEGPFVKSSLNGRGKFTWPDGSWYEGEIFEGKRHGEGLYTAADNIVRYQGQWMNGRRHGYGKLSYDVAGESYYVGQWENGCKHGEGKQVWPSRNVYEGRWRLGHMSGEGHMTWCDNGVAEHYKGHWENDRPHGTGSHTWHAPESSSEGAMGLGKQMPSQQMNNCYQGDWRKGVRHGQGSFCYANGARYDGSWVGNTKKGEGRYTYEDGRVYSGGFANDQMTDGAPLIGKVNQTALNIGNEDNPVRRCIDVSDLQAFCLPADVGTHDFSVGSGYDEVEEVFREVYNMLLRYIGELKQFYSGYRQLLRKSDEDPFVMTSRQLWLFARDAELASPACSLGRLNRCVFAGPRHLQETADGQRNELRPLTPRQAVSPTAEAMTTFPPADAAAILEEEAQEEDREGSSRGNSGLQSRASQSSRPSLERRQSNQGEAVAGRDSVQSASAPATQAAASPEGLQMQTLQEAADAEDALGNSLGQWSRLSTGNVGAVVPEFTSFWRGEDWPFLADVHSPSNPLMFRHFLDGVVRMALARFPNEKGLEHQVRRLFKELLLPLASRAALSQASPNPEVYRCLADAGVQKVLLKRKPVLEQVFRGCCTGYGGYRRPEWAARPAPAVAEDAQPAEQQDVSLPEPPQFLRQSSKELPQLARRPSQLDTPESPKSPSKARQGLPQTPQTMARSSMTKLPDVGEEETAGEQEEDQGPEVEYFVPNRRTVQLGPPQRLGFGGPHRRVHLRARLDVTIRAKDVLKYLDRLGLLAPLEDNWAAVLGLSDGAAEEHHEEAQLHADPNPQEGHTSEERRDSKDAGSKRASRQGSKIDAEIVAQQRSKERIVVTPSDRLQELCGRVLAPLPTSPAAFACSQDTLSSSTSLREVSASQLVLEAATSPVRGTLGPGGRSMISGLTNGGTSSSVPAGATGSALGGTLFPGFGGTDEDELQVSALKSVTDKSALAGNGDALGGEPSMDEASFEAAMTECDFSRPFMEALSMLTEGLGQASLEQLRWAVATDAVPRDEQVSLLEYLETELTYSEFTRILIRIAERVTEGLEVGGLPLDRRAAFFLDRIVKPALDVPYKPPAKQAGEVDFAAAGSQADEHSDGGMQEQASPAGALGQQGPAGTAGAGAEADGLEDIERSGGGAPPHAPPPPPKFWRGFEGIEQRCLVEPISDRAPPMWPYNYEVDVANW